MNLLEKLMALYTQKGTAAASQLLTTFLIQTKPGPEAKDDPQSRPFKLVREYQSGLRIKEDLPNLDF